MTNADSAALWDRLYRELVRAETEHYSVQEQATRILLDRMNGVAEADGLYQRMRSQKQARTAFRNYERALERFRAFVDDGVVPED